jgi:hypothetical protein
MKIITQNGSHSEDLTSSIQNFYETFHLSSVAQKANFTKVRGVPFKILFCYLISVIFSHRSAYRDYLKNQDKLNFSDKTFRNLMNDGRINWQRFLLSVSQKVAVYFSTLTNESRKNVYIIDDSMYARPNGKKVELSAYQYDHAKHKKVRGFRFLQLGWSDGNSFLPVSFSLLSGKNKQVSAKNVDKRSNSGKRKEQARRKGTDVMIELLSEAQRAGHQANYVLFDSWFSSPKTFRAVHELGLHAVAIVKRSSKVHYQFNGEMTDVKAIFDANKKRRGRSRYLLSVLVKAVYEDGQTLPIKLVYVRNRNKRNEYLVLASTDTTLTEDEIIQLYGKRWSIEVYFKMCKQYLHLAKYQGLSYDGIFAHCVLVATSYIILSLKQRQESDERTIGELFYLMVDELADITFSQAIHDLIELFHDAFKAEPILREEVLDNIIEKFMATLPQSVRKQVMDVA